MKICLQHVIPCTTDLKGEHLFPGERDKGQDDDSLLLGLQHSLDQEHLGNEGLAGGSGSGVHQVAAWKDGRTVIQFKSGGLSCPVVSIVQ